MHRSIPVHDWEVSLEWDWTWGPPNPCNPCIVRFQFEEVSYQNSIQTFFKWSLHKEVQTIAGFEFHLICKSCHVCCRVKRTSTSNFKRVDHNCSKRRSPTKKQSHAWVRIRRIWSCQRRKPTCSRSEVEFTLELIKIRFHNIITITCWLSAPFFIANISQRCELCHPYKLLHTHPIWHDLIHALLGTKSLLSVIVCLVPYWRELITWESAGLEFWASFCQQIGLPEASASPTELRRSISVIKKPFYCSFIQASDWSIFKSKCHSNYFSQLKCH